jgi:hypothetical protein
MRPKSHLRPTESRNQTRPPGAAGAKNPDRPQILLVSRLLLNDQLWSQGDIVVVEGGRAIHLTPHF